MTKNLAAIGEPYFLTASELNEVGAKRPVVLFGAGCYGEETLSLMKHRPAFFVDNNRAKEGAEFHGVQIMHPDSLADYLTSHSDAYVVVCVQAYQDLAEQLHGFGLNYGLNCGISPVEYELGVIAELKSHDQTILFSNYEAGGGLYQYNFKSKALNKVLDESVLGFVRAGGFLYCTSSKGLHKLDAQTFEQNALLDLSIYQIDGIDYDSSNGTLVVAGTQTDEIIVVDVDSFQVVKRTRLSAKYDAFGRECHHVTDILVREENILASVHSLSGRWNSGIVDGGLFEIDKRTWDIKPIKPKDVSIVNSPKLHDGHLYLLDSMNGRLVRDLQTTVVEFDAFVRGLEFNGRYCYVGQSTYMEGCHFKDLPNTNTDCGIHIFDMENHISRFVQFENMNSIFQITAWDAS